ncbi:GNAT family N-acetyltransferase [Microbacterium sp. NPDC089696]|uniref:GNAT family N-acetyltransferase n=1 Tax=Microbacterium sp. NPDC089696 TaxID=3364199 RepID=UPI00382A0DCC
MPTFMHAPLRDISAETLYKLLWLRISVFVVEQRAAYPDLDGRDLEPDTQLVWLEEEDEVLATARILFDAATATSDRMIRVGRVATAANARGRGLGSELMQAVIGRVEQREPHVPITLDAQKHLAHWYAQFGFAISGAEFIEDGIPHVPMTRPAL